MNKVKKVRCPHCRKINTVNIDEELKKHDEVVFKMLIPKSKITAPKTIAVTCSNPECKKSFKIDIS